MQRSLLLCAVLGLYALASIALADSKSYALPGHGALKLDVPSGWREQVGRPSANLPPTIELQPASGPRFHILLTPIWRMREDVPLPTAESARQLVESSRNQAQARAVEKELSIEMLAGNTGYYFTATDSQLEPGGYPHMTQGAAVVGELVVTFTILTDAGQDDIVRQALGMVGQAQHAR